MSSPDSQPLSSRADDRNDLWWKLLHACASESDGPGAPSQSSRFAAAYGVAEKIVISGQGVPIACQGSDHLYQCLKGRPGAGTWAREQCSKQLGQHDAVPDVVMRIVDYAVQGSIDDGTPDSVGPRARILEDERPQHLAGLLVILAMLTLLAGEEHIGTLGLRQVWQPDPRRLPDWRRTLIKEYAGPHSRVWMGNMVAGPLLHSVLPVANDPADAADVLLAQEARRLSGARLYYADAVQCGIAARKALRPRTTPLSEHRVPAPFGMIVFEQPVHTVEQDILITGASWGLWNPGEPPAQNGWEIADPTEGVTDWQPPTGKAWWITLYAAPTNKIRLPIVYVDHRVVTEALRHPEPANEQILIDVAVRTVIASWDLITQGLVARPIIDIQELPRRPKDVRADRRRGISDDGRVRLITIKPRTPAIPRARTEDGQDEQQEARTARTYRHRWHVTAHDRDHCMNPRLHAEKQCTHENITIVDYIKGPSDAPWADTVHVLKGVSPQGSGTAQE